MRLIQTLWTSTNDLKKDKFGWVSAKYHLLGWVLSAITLSKLTNDLELYTDSQGKKVLVDILKLPYTKVHVCYDDLNIPKEHWAIPKVLTYSKQTEPFIHIDGDVFLPNGFPEGFLNKDWYHKVLILVLKGFLIE